MKRSLLRGVLVDEGKGLEFGVTNTEENRVNTIAGFLAEARKRLIPYNVFLAADIFGYVAWNVNDTQIGQKIDHLTTAVDYISLMLTFRVPLVNPRVQESCCKSK